jgi:GNAT superfamily N-acetyltransferase
MATRRTFIAKTKEDLERCFQVMRELRPHLTYSTFIEIYENSKCDDYEIVAIEDGSQIVALMGYRITWDMVRGKYLYIDDLVTTEQVRSQGLGAQLLKYAEEKARELNCKGGLRLCTGMSNERGIKFYEREGWTKRSFAYVKKV